MNVIGHDAIGVEFVMLIGFPVDFIRHDLRDVFLPEPVMPELTTIEPVVEMPEILLLDVVAFCGSFGGAQFLFALRFQLVHHGGGERIHEAKGDEERIVLRVDVRQFAAVVDGFGHGGSWGSTTNFSLSFLGKRKLKFAVRPKINDF